MSKTLLDKTRRLNKILQDTGSKTVSFLELAKNLKEILESNIYITSKKGKILGVSVWDENDSPIEYEEETGKGYFPSGYNEEILKVAETEFNITQDRLLEIFKKDIESYDKFATIVPIIGNGDRMGTMILARGNSYNDEDLVLAEYAATVVGMEIIRSNSEMMEEEARKRAVVQMAIGTLSYSELEAIEHIFNELDGEEGLLVASKIADRVGITRSVIVNALRKFESAGVIESRSLGMKGTHIRILNNKLLEELEKVKG